MSSRATRRKVRVEPRTVPDERPGPEGGVRDRRRRERTAALATAALRLFLDRGVEAVTIDDIASRAGLAKGTFYTYFRDKADVAEALLAPVSSTVRASFERCEKALREAEEPAALVAAYQALALELAAVLTANPGVTLLYLQESRAPAMGARKPIADLAREVRERAVALTLAAREHGMLKPIDPRVSAHAVVGAVEAMVFSALSGDAFGDVGEVTAALIELILHGVAAPR